MTKRKKYHPPAAPMYDEYETLVRAGRYEEMARLACSRMGSNKSPTEIIDGTCVYATREDAERHARLRLEENAVYLVPYLLKRLDEALKDNQP